MQPYHHSPGETKENPSMRPLDLTCHQVLNNKTENSRLEFQSQIHCLPPLLASLPTSGPWAWDHRELDPNPYFKDPPHTPSQSPFLLACLSPTSPTVPSWDCSEFLKPEFQLRLCYPTCHVDQGPL